MQGKGEKELTLRCFKQFHVISFAHIYYILIDAPEPHKRKRDANILALLLKPIY